VKFVVDLSDEDAAMAAREHVEYSASQVDCAMIEGMVEVASMTTPRSTSRTHTMQFHAMPMLLYGSEIPNANWIAEWFRFKFFPLNINYDHNSFYTYISLSNRIRLSCQ
jgi:hypothetical protein